MCNGERPYYKMSRVCSVCLVGTYISIVWINVKDATV